MLLAVSNFGQTPQTAVLEKRDAPGIWLGLPPNDPHTVPMKGKWLHIRTGTPGPVASKVQRSAPDSSRGLEEQK